MSSATIHLVYRNASTKRANQPDEPPPAAAGRLPRWRNKAAFEEAATRIWAKPLTAPPQLALAA